MASGTAQSHRGHDATARSQEVDPTEPTAGSGRPASAREARLAKVLDTMAEGVIAVDAAGRVTEANPAAARILGLPTGELIGRTVPGPRVRLVRPDGTELPPDEHPVTRCLVTATTFPDAVLGMQVGDGPVTWIHATAAPLTDERGRSAGAVATFSDITAQIAIEHALRDSERRYRLLAEHSSEVVLQTGTDGRIAWASPSLATVLGHQPADVVGARVSDLLEPAEIDRLRQEMASNVSAHRPGGQRRIRFATAGGGYRWMSALGHAVYDESGAVIGGIDALRDIDEQVRIEQALQAERTLLKATMDATLDPHVVLSAIRDDDGRIVDFAFAEANDAACAYNGLSREGLLGRTVMGLLPAHRETGLLDRYADVVESGRPLVLDDYTYPHEILAEPRRFDIRAVKVGDAISYTWRDVTDRAEAAARVAAQQAELSLLLDTMAEGVVMISPDGLIVSANQAAQRIVRLSLDELAGRSFVTDRLHLVRPDGRDLPADEHPVSLALRTGEPVRDMVIGVTGEGQDAIWVRVSANPLPGEEPGRTGGVVATFNDITAAVQAEAAVRQARERLALVLESSRLGSWDWDMASGTVVVDDRWAQLIGYTVDEVAPVTADSWRGMLHPDDLPLVEDAIAEHARGEVDSYDVEFRMRHRDGSWVWVHAPGRIVERRPDGTPVRMTGTHQDVTALRTATDLLRSSEIRYRTVVQATASGLVVQAADGSVIDCNAAAERMLGLTRDQLLGRTSIDPRWQSVHEDGSPFPGEDHPAMVTLATGKPQSGVVMGVRTPSGQLTWLNIDTVPFTRPEAPDEPAVIVSFTDVTATVDTERELAASEARYRLLAENASDFVVYAGMDGILRWVSPSTSRVLGREADDLLGKAVSWIVHPDDLLSLVEAQATVSVGDTAVKRLRVRSADGAARWFLASCRPVRDDAGRLVGRVTSFQDVQAETEARQQLRDAHERLDLVLQSSRLGLWDWNMATGEVVINDRWAEIVGYRLADLAPVTIDTWSLLTHPDDLAESEALIEAHVSGQTGFYDIDCRMRHRDGRWVWVRDRGRVVEWAPDGTALRMTGTHEDITALKHATDALAESEELFRVVMASAPVGTAVLDLDRRIVHANPALCALVGRSQTWLEDRTLGAVLDEPDDRLDQRMRAHLATVPTTSVSIELRLQRADGALVWVQQSINTLTGPDGAATGYVSQFVDITEIREARRRLRDLAARDPLTNLLNRRELTTRISDLLARRQRTGTDLAVLFIDLDGLKAINDTHGHLVGDQVIQQVAERIRAVVRYDDVVARYGGDEFVVLLPQIHHLGDAQRIAEHIQATSREPISMDGLDIIISYSIGLATTDQDPDPDTLLARADASVYRAKREGRGRTVIYDADLDSIRP